MSRYDPLARTREIPTTTLSFGPGSRGYKIISRSRNLAAGEGLGSRWRGGSLRGHRPERGVEYGMKRRGPLLRMGQSRCRKYAMTCGTLFFSFLRPQYCHVRGRWSWNWSAKPYAARQTIVLCELSGEILARTLRRYRWRAPIYGVHLNGQYCLGNKT